MRSRHRSLPRTTMVSALEVERAELRCSWRPIFIFVMRKTFRRIEYPETLWHCLSTQLRGLEHRPVPGSRWRAPALALGGAGPPSCCCMAGHWISGYWDPLAPLLDGTSPCCASTAAASASRGSRYPAQCRGPAGAARCGRIDVAVLGMSQGARLAIHFALRTRNACGTAARWRARARGGIGTAAGSAQAPGDGGARGAACRNPPAPIDALAERDPWRTGAARYGLALRRP